MEMEAEGRGREEKREEAGEGVQEDRETEPSRERRIRTAQLR